MWRAIGLNLSLFGMLFLLHIVAARFDANTAFTVVAILITVHVLFFGPACLVVSRVSSQEHRRILNRWGLWPRYRLRSAWDGPTVGWRGLGPNGPDSHRLVGRSRHDGQALGLERINERWFHCVGGLK